MLTPIQKSTLAQISPPPIISLAIMVAISYVQPSEFASMLTTMAAVLIGFSWFIAKFKPAQRMIQKHKWTAALFAAPFASIIGQPAYAQLSSGDACAGSGIFNPVAEFVVNVFANFNLGSSSNVGSIPQWICGLFAAILVIVVIAFIVMLAYAALKISQGDITSIIGPFIGFMVFLLGSYMVVTYLIGAN